MGNCIRCGSTVSRKPDAHHLQRHLSDEVLARGDDPKLVKVDGSPPPVHPATEAKTRICDRKAEELLRIVETRGLPPHQELAHLLPDTGHATVGEDRLRPSPPKLVRVDGVVPVQPAAAQVKTKISRKKAEELLRIVETQGLPLHQVFAHLLPDTRHATVRRSLHRRPSPKLVKDDASPVQPAEANTKTSKKKAEELLRIVETQGLPLHQVFAHLLPDTRHATVGRSLHRRHPPKLVRVDASPAHPAATETSTKTSKKKAEELLPIVGTQGLPLHQVLAHVLPDTDHVTTVFGRRRRWQPALDSIPEVPE